MDEREIEREEGCARVHRRLKRIVRARGALDMQEAAALREAERLRVWRHYGYSSLLEYMEMEMGYSPRVALERLRVANAIVELPAIAEALTQGELSFSAARELTRVATAETEGVWIEAASDKNLRQVEQLVSGHKTGDKPSDPPDPSLRKRRLRFDELEPETVALVRQARQILERECGERMDDNAALRAFARMVIDGAAAERKSAPYQIAVVTCEVCKRAWQDGGGISVEMSAATREAALCDARHIGRVDRSGDGMIDRRLERSVSETSIAIVGDGRLERPASERTIAEVGNGGPERPASERSIENLGDGRLDRPASEASSDNVGGARSEQWASEAWNEARRVRSAIAPARENEPARRARSAIPPALRRQVNARDHGTCRVPWCRSSRNIDQHHLQPVCEGGRHTLENLITLCESHHLALHEGSLVVEGDAMSARFTQRAHSSFAAAQHAVEAAQALRALGFDKHEVRTAIDRTRTHVGTAALRLEDWIKIALGYCPKPTG